MVCELQPFPANPCMPPAQNEEQNLFDWPLRHSLKVFFQVLYAMMMTQPGIQPISGNPLNLFCYHWAIFPSAPMPKCKGQRATSRVLCWMLLISHFGPELCTASFLTISAIEDLLRRSCITPLSARTRDVHNSY